MVELMVPMKNISTDRVRIREFPKFKPIAVRNHNLTGQTCGGLNGTTVYHEQRLIKLYEQQGTILKIDGILEDGDDHALGMAGTWSKQEITGLWHKEEIIDMWPTEKIKGLWPKEVK
jgi:hypothetical protein